MTGYESEWAYAAALQAQYVVMRVANDRPLEIGDVEPREDLPARGVPVFASQTVFDPLALDYVVGARPSRVLINGRPVDRQ